MKAKKKKSTHQVQSTGHLKRTGKLLQDYYFRTRYLRRGAFNANFSITTPELLILPVHVILLFLLPVFSLL